MGTLKDGRGLVAGMTLYDVDTKSIGILIRRFSTRETQFYDSQNDYNIPYELIWEMEPYVTWVWDSVWSKDGRVIYSETGLTNLIKAGIIVVVDDDSSYAEPE
jgi:hypothetical protein